jgi:Nucleotide modification associated domain 2
VRPKQRYFVYQMTVDNGGAPCCHAQLLTLALGKSGIRAVAAPGDVLVGVAGARIDGAHGLIYAARIDRRLDAAQYYGDESPYSDRPDCIYRLGADGSCAVRAHAYYHSDGLEAASDLGPPPEYRSGTVLVSRAFRYFGASRRPLEREQYPHLRAALDAPARGARLRVAGALVGELGSLIDTLFAAFPDAVQGRPTHHSATRCDRDNDYELISA